MTNSKDGGEVIREQNNYGEGTFIGGDNHGDIHVEALSVETKKLLVKMSKDSPELARMLARALRDGVISQDVAQAVGMAARSINEDVARMLGMAARSINEDVATMLWEAGRNINDDVARRLVAASEKLNPTVAEQISHSAGVFSKAAGGVDELRVIAAKIERAAESLNSAVGNLGRLKTDVVPVGRLDVILGGLNDAAGRIEAVVTPPPAKIIVDREVTVKAFFVGAFVGAVLVIVLLSL